MGKRKDDTRIPDTNVHLELSRDKRRFTVVVESDEELSWYLGTMLAFAYLKDEIDKYEEPPSPRPN